MRKPQSKFEILERDAIYYLLRNEKEQFCPENFTEKVNCGSWCPFFSIRFDSMNGVYFYYVDLYCRHPGVQFKITADIIE